MSLLPRPRSPLDVRGLPTRIARENGGEHVSVAIGFGVQTPGVALDPSSSDQPTGSSTIESLNHRLGDACLRMDRFEVAQAAQQAFDALRRGD